MQPCSKFWFRESTSGLCPGHCSRSKWTQSSITPGTIRVSLHDYATEMSPAAVVKGVPAVQPLHACCTTDRRLLSSGGCQAPSLPCLRILHLCKPLPDCSGLYRLAFVCGMVAACRSGDLDHQASAQSTLCSMTACCLLFGMLRHVRLREDIFGCMDWPGCMHMSLSALNLALSDAASLSGRAEWA